MDNFYNTKKLGICIIDENDEVIASEPFQLRWTKYVEKEIKEEIKEGINSSSLPQFLDVMYQEILREFSSEEGMKVLVKLYINSFKEIKDDEE